MPTATRPAGATPTTRAGYPAPGTGTPVASPPAGAIPTPATPTITPGVVRSRIQATDPRMFQIASGQPQLVMFFANWSKESSSVAPVINALQNRYKDRILFTFLDIEDPGNSLFKALIGSRVPLFFLLDAQGNVLNEWQGVVPAADFEAAFNAAGG